MSSSPRPLSTISLAAIVLSATLSVLLSADHSFAQLLSPAPRSSATTSYRSPPAVLLVACDRRRVGDLCYQKCEAFGAFGMDPHKVKKCNDACYRANGC